MSTGKALKKGSIAHSQTSKTVVKKIINVTVAGIKTYEAKTTSSLKGYVIHK